MLTATPNSFYPQTYLPVAGQTDPARQIQPDRSSQTDPARQIQPDRSSQTDPARQIQPDRFSLIIVQEMYS
jgi:hypothetical protein